MNLSGLVQGADSLCGDRFGGRGRFGYDFLSVSEETRISSLGFEMWIPFALFPEGKFQDSGRSIRAWSGSCPEHPAS
jgi:hypothetical protein